MQESIYSKNSLGRLHAVALILILATSGFGQAERKSTQAEPSRKTQSVTPESPTEKGDKQDQPVKLEATLVTVPVIASDRDGKYIPDMRREEFSLREDGVNQEIVFFGTVSEPFHVILMLDTSASTQEKLGQIKSAARTFVEQLKPADRVKIISFDDAVRDLCEFTNDRAAKVGASTLGRRCRDKLDVGREVVRQDHSRSHGRTPVGHQNRISEIRSGRYRIGRIKHRDG